MGPLVEKWAALPAGQRYLIALTIIAGLAGGYYYFLHEDSQQTYDNLMKTYEQRQTEQAELKGVRDNRKKYEEKLAQYQKELDDVRRQLPDKADVPQLLSQMSDRARKVGMVLVEFKPMDEVNKGFYSEIPFQMSAKGSYHEIAMFVDSVGKLDRIVNVSNLSMGEPIYQESKVVLKSSFNVKTYRFTQQAQIKK